MSDFRGNGIVRDWLTDVSGYGRRALLGHAGNLFGRLRLHDCGCDGL
ncbi:MAG: hypothetical protein WCF85_19585 [Rhodospirillaceae bacterium]